MIPYQIFINFIIINLKIRSSHILFRFVSNASYVALNQFIQSIHKVTWIPNICVYQSQLLSIWYPDCDEFKENELLRVLLPVSQGRQPMHGVYKEFERLYDLTLNDYGRLNKCCHICIKNCNRSWRSQAASSFYSSQTLCRRIFPHLLIYLCR